jgi:hypothetical protein
MAGENPQTTMPPVPREPLIDRNGQMSSQWTRWLQQIQRILSFAGGIAWAIINKTASRLSDIETRTHAMLQSVLGTGDRHITAAENAEITALDALAAGIVVKVGNASYTVRSIQGTANEIVLSFGDGQSGNPTVSLPLRISGPREFGTETNKAVIEADGTIKLEGDATGWQDENLSGAVSAVGPNAPTLVNWDTSSISVPALAHNLTKELQMIREFDHAGKAGALVVHAHILPTVAGTGTVKLFCEYYIKNDGLAAVAGTLNATLTLTGTAWEEQRLNLGTITNAIITQGTQIGLRLYRLSTDAGTFNNPVAISTWGYHYEIDTPAGSRQITAK